MYHHHHHHHHRHNHHHQPNSYESMNGGNTNGIEAFNLQHSFTMPHIVYQPASNESSCGLQPSGHSGQLLNGGTTAGGGETFVYLNQLYTYPVSSTHTHFDPSTTTYDPHSQYDTVNIQQQQQFDGYHHQYDHHQYDPVAVTHQYEQPQYDTMTTITAPSHYEVHSNYENAHLEVQQQGGLMMTTTTTMNPNSTLNNQVGCQTVGSLSLPPPPPPPPLTLQAQNQQQSQTSPSELPPASVAPTSNQLNTNTNANSFQSNQNQQMSSSQPIFTINAVGPSGACVTNANGTNVPSIIFHIDCTTQPPSIHQETPSGQQAAVAATTAMRQAAATTFNINNSGASLNYQYTNSTSGQQINIPIDLNLPYTSSNVDSNCPTQSQTGLTILSHIPTSLNLFFSLSQTFCFLFFVN